MSRTCRTPGAIFHTDINPKSVGIKVDLGDGARVMSEEEAKKLEDRMHDLMEAELAFLYE